MTRFFWKGQEVDEEEFIIKQGQLYKHVYDNLAEYESRISEPCLRKQLRKILEYDK